MAAREVVHAIREHAQVHGDCSCVWCQLWGAYVTGGLLGRALVDEQEAAPSADWGEALWTAKELR